MFNFLTAASAGGMGGTVVMMVAMLALMYFMLIRPENKRKKKEEEMRAALKAGDSITTIGGVKGVVVDVKEGSFVMETGADRVRIEFAKFARSRTTPLLPALRRRARKPRSRLPRPRPPRRLRRK